MTGLPSRLGDGRTLRGEGEDGALRYAITVRIDGRIFDQVSLDINVVGPNDPRPAELVRFTRNPFEFVGEVPLEIPMVPLAHQLAEKLHAYTRRYDGETSSRAKDMFDMLVIAAQLELPRGAALARGAQQTFHVRTTAWPPDLLPPPPDWAAPWAAFVADHPLPWNNLQQAFAALKQFWEPVLSGAAGEADLSWHPLGWRWVADRN
jgi:hypothetical protein